LYSIEFYTQLRRLLKYCGAIYHYIGDPNSKESGGQYGSVAERLRRAGFSKVEKVPQAFGVVAVAG
jgi:predicted methyltransferase